MPMQCAAVCKYIAVAEFFVSLFFVTNEIKMQDKSETIPSLSRGMSGGNNPPFRSSMSSLLSRHPVPNNDHGPPSIMRSVTTAPKYNRTASNNGYVILWVKNNTFMFL